MTDKELKAAIIKFSNDTNSADVPAGLLPGYGLPNFEHVLEILQREGKLIAVPSTLEQMTEIKYTEYVRFPVRKRR